MTSAFPTYGEAFAERELRKERRAGTEHYVVGQHHAVVIEPDDPREAEGAAAMLTYCSLLGLVGVPMVKPEGGDWEPLVPFSRVLGLRVDYGTKPLPDDWAINDEMRRVLDEAVAGG